MKYLILIALLTTICACRESDKRNENGKQMNKPSGNEVSFCSVYRDSVFIKKYQLMIEKISKENTSYSYKNSKDSFVLIYNSLANSCKALMSNVTDTVVFESELKKYYVINGEIFNVFKFVRDKNSVDGAVTYFFSPKIGLLLIRSNTWRNGEILAPEKDQKNYLQIEALIFNVLTDCNYFISSHQD